MAEIAVTLGDVTFEDFEVPESMRAGGAQVLKLHKLVGGQRVVDSMGRDDHPLTWSGTFLGPEALSRAQQLDAMRVAGAQVVLTFSEYRFKVAISDFTPDIHRAYWIPYSITCEVVADQGLQTTQDADPTVDDALISDITDAQSLQASAGLA